MSIRTRLLAIALALLVTGIVVSDAVVTAALRQRLVARVDHQVAPLAQVLARINPQIVMSARTPGEARNLDLVNDVAVAYLRADGTLEATKAASTGGPRFDAGLLAATPGTAVTHGGWRVVTAARPAGGVVAVAASLSATDAIVNRLRLICLITGLGLVVLLAAVGWFAVRAGLRPLRSIERSAAAIAGGDLAHRIPAAGPPGSEIARLTGVLNRMLAQIEQAFAARAASEARMRRFVADVSHELRTPLFGIKGSAELHLMGGDAAPAMQRIDREAGRLATLVEDLLLLARLDEPAGGPVLETAPMDLRTLAVDARHDLLALDPGREVRLTGPAGAGAPGSHAEDGPGAALVMGDEARLRQVAVNLVGNVRAHTPPGSPVRIGVGRVGGEAVLEIADSGPGLTPEQASRVFERFYRGDDSRSRGTGAGAGLGLSIVRSLVAAHGGRVEVTGRSGATFRLCLPALTEDALTEDAEKS